MKAHVVLVYADDTTVWTRALLLRSMKQGVNYADVVGKNLILVGIESAGNADFAGLLKAVTEGSVSHETWPVLPC